MSLLLQAPDAGVLLSRPVRIAAPHADLRNKEARGRYWGGVTVEREALTLTCDELEVFYSAQQVDHIVAVGHVHAVEGDREAFGELATYSNQTGVLTVTGHPHARLAEREVEGERITFTTGVEHLEIERAHSVVKEPADQRVVIDADLLSVESPRNEITWKGHVKALKDQTRLVAPELTATYDAQGLVTRIQARGGVEVTQKDRWARGQNADYDVPAGKLVVTGHPRARDGKTRLKGTRVTFFTQRELLEVENAETIIDVEKDKVR